MADVAITDVTVAITTYNRWDSVNNALQSILEQVPRAFEIIVVDDCSDEPPPEELCQKMKSNGVRFIRHSRNRGLAAARNTAIDAAGSRFFAFCDDDDQWPSGFLRQFQRSTDSASAESAFIFYSQALAAAKDDYSCSLKELFLKGYTPPVASQFYLTEILKSVGGYDQDVKTGVDHDLWVRLLPLNPMFRVSFATSAIVGNDAHASRMTTREAERLERMKRSMAIWRPQISDALGHDFFDHFESSYIYYLEAGFFKKSLDRREYWLAVQRLKKRNVRNFLFKKVFDRIRSVRSSQAFLPFPKRRTLK